MAPETFGSVFARSPFPLGFIHLFASALRLLSWETDSDHIETILVAFFPI
jgi:hypothetical protein